MRALVLGGAASGKSEYAESLAVAMPGRRIYIATMEPWGAEGQARVARHRELRAGKGFETLERYTDLAGLQLPDGASVLLECLGNLTANEIFSPNGGGLPALRRGLDALAAKCEHFVIVSNDIFADDGLYEESTRDYVRALAEMNRHAAALCDRVYEVVCGIPLGRDTK